MTHLVDAKYYEAVPSGSLAERLLRVARDRVYRDFIRVCAPLPRHRIVDVGVSDIVNDVANPNILKNLRFCPRQTVERN